MTDERLLLELVDEGVQLWAEGVELRYKAPRGVTTARLLDKLRRHKARLLAALGQDQKYALPSFAQERHWLLHRLVPAASVYNVPLAFRLRGRLDAAALAAALAELACRHETLATTFRELDGRPLQRIDLRWRPALPVVDLRRLADPEAAAARIARQEVDRPFDLAGGRLLRLLLLRSGDESHLLVLTLHHAIADGWSLAVLTAELEQLYRSFVARRRPRLAALPLQYADFAHWQRRRLRGAVLEELLAYWRETLRGLAALPLPTDRPRPATPTGRGGVCAVSLGRPLTQALERCRRAAGETLYTTLLAGFFVLLHRLTGQREVALGTLVGNRGRQELEGLVGSFVNTLVLRGRVERRETFAELLARTRDVALGAFAHQELPFEKLVGEIAPERQPGQNPLVQVTLNLHSAPLPRLRMPGLEAELVEVELARSGLDLELHLAPAGDVLEGFFVYDAELFDATTVERFSRQLRAVLEQVSAAPRRVVQEVTPWSAAELHQILVEWNDTPAPPDRDESFPELFAAWARRRPEATALVFGEERVSYGELDRRSGRLARRLRGLGAGPESRVAVLFQRSTEMIVALLGVLRAGAAYVPLDPDHPPKRLTYLVEDAGCGIVVTRRELALKLPAARHRLVLLDEEPREEGTAAELPLAAAGPAHLAYVIYTSGSTGRPKGVMVRHRELANLARDPTFGAGPGDAVLQFASLAFDVSVWEIVAALAHGAALHLARREELLPGPPLAALLKARGIEHFEVPPSVLQAVDPATELPALKTVMVGAEACPAGLAERWAGGGRTFLNCYGPTEVTVTATAGVFRRRGRPPPIGRPLENVEAYVLDAGTRPLGIGLRGEIYLGGPGVARGYLARPRETAERFVPHPFRGPGARLYKTGDRAFLLGDGNLEFLGRDDSQVKLRGHRVELGEIEAVLRARPEVREAVVTARGEGATRRLVAYVAGDELDPSSRTAALRSFLGERLPAHMVPSAFVVLGQLPRLPNGKVDRQALPLPDGARRSLATVFLAPENATEATLAEIWSELLEVDAVGRDDNFFDLGGHSLLATRAISRIRERLGLEVELVALFEEPTVRRLAQRLQRPPPSSGEPLVRLPESAGGHPLSFAQERMWFLEQLEPGLRAFVLADPVRLRGPLDAAALVAAVAELERRHPALRTVFPELDAPWGAGGEICSEPRQLVRPCGRPAFLHVDLTHLAPARRLAESRRLARRDGVEPFDLVRGPLQRSTLLRLGPADHVLLRTLHHIVSDGWSEAVLHHELPVLYAAAEARRPSPLVEPAIRYTDFAVWQRRHLRGEVLERQLRYWRRQLGGELPAAELPTDRPRPRQSASMGRPAGLLSLDLPVPLADALRRIARGTGASFFMTLLAVFFVLVRHLTGQRDIPVGVPVAGRQRPDLEDLVGPFLNTVVLRGDLGGEPTFQELAARVRDVALAAYAHQDLPFERLVEELAPARRLGHNPLFQVLFAIGGYFPKRAGLKLPGLATEPLPIESGHLLIELYFLVEERGGRLIAEVDFQKTLFDDTTIHRLLRSYAALASGFAADPGAPVVAVSAWSAAERHQTVVEWNDSGELRGPPFLELFERRARLGPSLPAVSEPAAGQELSYAELDARASGLAADLGRRGLGPESRVALLFERSVDLVAALLGVHKAGGAYVPLDPTWPRARLARVLRHAGVDLLITHGRVVWRHPRLRALAGAQTLAPYEVLFFDAAETAAAARRERPGRQQGAALENAAYVIYTSGSTDQPKGVVVTRGSLAWYVAAARRHFGLEARDRILQFVSPSFDVSVGEIFPALASGAHLVLRDETMADSARELLRGLRQHKISVAFLPTAFWHEVAAEVTPAEVAPSLRLVVVVGERVRADRIADWRRAVGPGVRLVDGYGPTEATVLATLHDTTDDPHAATARNPTIGRPMARTAAHVADRGLRSVTVGVAGELLLAGPGLARGYLGQPAATARSFVPDPLGGGREAPGARLYRTGDLVRRRRDGRLEYLGRIDHQVKVRGFLVDPQEIERALVAAEGVREAVVILRRQAPAGLVAYLAGDPGLDVGVLRQKLAATLPEYMVPAAFVVLESLPLTASGKLARATLHGDRLGRTALRRAFHTERAGPEQATLVAPRTPAEEILSGIWCRVLGLEAVSVDDNFFQLGGHSLNATRVLARIRETFRVELPLRRLFERPTLGELATSLVTTPEPAAAPLVPVSRRRKIAPSFAQQRLWFLDQLEPESRAYHMPSAWHLAGRLDLGALAGAVAALCRRHEILRAAFPASGGEPELVVAENAPALLPLVDLGTLGAERRGAEQERLAARLARRPFDLAHGPLLRLALLRHGQDEHVFVLNVHHIVFDAWSQSIFHLELASFYDAFSRRSPAPLPELAVQYADFAAWQRKTLSGELLRAEWAYWRRQLHDLPQAVELPADRPRPPLQSHRGATERLVLSPRLAGALQKLSLTNGATLFMTLLTAYMTLVARYSGQSDIVVGSPIAGRGHPRLEELIGLFVNNLVLRARLGANPRFAEFLAQVRETALQAYSRHDLPFEMLVERLVPERDLSRHRLFQITFALQNMPVSKLELRGLASRPFEIPFHAARFDLECYLWEHEGNLAGGLSYNVDVFDATTIRRFGDSFLHLLRSVAASPAARLAELELLGPAQRHQLLHEWQTPGEAPAAAAVHRLLAARAARSDGGVALQDETGRTWTYRDLERRANHLAHRLRALGTGLEARVGICARPRPETVAAMVAVWKAGGAYVPLDPSYPDAHLTRVLEDARLSALVLGPSQVHRFPPGAAPGARRVALAEGLAGERDAAPALADVPEAAAYVIYTSGSTGAPKGVVVSHENLLASTRERLRYYARPGKPPARFLLLSSIAFDSSVAGLFGTLAEGGVLTLVCDEARGDPERLGALIERFSITRLLAVPALYEQILIDVDPARLRGLDSVIVAGEACPPALVARHRRSLPRTRLDNEYGPTEGSVWSTVHACQGTEESTVPIGRPIPGVRAYVLDRQLAALPAGVAGELYLGGAGIARGYQGASAATAARFLPDPFAGGQRLYRTGDLVRRWRDGNLEFLGRLDHQVKVRGLRIELGEIESVLRRHPQVRDAAVVERPEGDAPRGLVAYVAADEDPAEEAPPELSQEHVADWRTLYDDLYAHTAPADPTFDTTGWKSSYTGEPIPAEEMREWVDETCARIRELCFLPRRPRRVLDVGCGTGLLLFRLAGECDEYAASDFSRAVLDGVAERLRAPANREQAARVRLDHRAADEIAGRGTDKADTVILSSVVQYFPGVEYLLRVLETAVAATAPGGRVFVGDVRNLQLLGCFHLSRELAEADDAVPVEELLRRAEERRMRERELVVDPSFFRAFARHQPRVSRVRLLPKGGRFTNELTRFRYDVVLELDGLEPSSAALEVEWRTWKRGEPSLAALRRRLTERPAAFGLRRVADPRVAEDVRLFEIPSRGEELATVADLRRVLGEPPPEAGLAPEDVYGLARDMGYAAELGLAPNGTYDVLLRRRDLDPSACSLPPGKRVRAAAGMWSAFGNNPLQSRQHRLLVPRLRHYLRQHLPAPMAPAALLVVAALPRTRNGKVDRTALTATARRGNGRGNGRGAPAADGRPELGSPYVAPRTTTERALVEIWCEVLHLEHVGIHDDFFELGGHSLLATQVVSRVRRALRVELPLRGLFEAATVARLAARLKDARRAGASLAAPPLHRAPRGGSLPLSFAQQRLWFLQQLEPRSTAYHAPATWRLTGRLDTGALRRAFAFLAERHETLRTRFPSRDGRPCQEIASRPKAPLLLVDLTRVTEARRRAEAHRIVAWALGRPFDLERDPPLRTLAVRLDRYRHVLQAVFHHVVFDGWSQGIFENELGAAYRAFHDGTAPRLVPLPLQYADFALWQRRWLSGEALEVQLAYWRERLGRDRAARLELPGDRPRTRRPRHRGALVRTAVPAAVAGPLKAFSLDAGASLFMTLLAVFTTLLHRLTGERRVTVGSPIANRTRQEIEGLIGFFVNVVVLDVDFSPGPGGAPSGGAPPSFRAVVDRVRETALGAYAHQDLPFEKLVEELDPERDLARNPLFQLVFALQNAPGSQLALPGLRVEPVEGEALHARFDLELFLWEGGEGLDGAAVYDRDLFDATTVQRWMRSFQHLLGEALARAGERIDRLPLLGPGERHQLLVEWNDTAREPPGRPVHELVAERAARDGERVAVVAEEATLTYRELDAEAEQLARYLRGLGVGGGSLVGVLMERSAAMVVALLAVWKAGAAYVPLDPSHPFPHRERKMDDAGIEVLLTRGRASTPKGLRLVDLDRDAEEIAAATAPRRRGRPGAPGESLAYLIYTSGTTGEPKGVKVSHQALASLLAAMAEEPGLGADDTLLAVTTISFDIAALEIFLPLVRGARLVVAGREAVRDPGLLAELAASSGASVMQATPATWRMLVAAGWKGRPDLKVLCGGEALPASLAAALGPRCRELWNLYGPTETTVWSLRRRVGEEAPDLPVVSIGRPIANTRLYVLDRRLRLLPAGAVGEIALGGAGLAQGYHRRGAATAERFVPDPTATAPGSRLYRTGDLGRRRADGEVAFLGRRDRQVKVRGFRIELGEIEALLAEHPAVAEAAVVPHPRTEDDVILVAWLVREGRQTSALGAEHLDQWRATWDGVYADSALHEHRFELAGWKSSFTGRPIPEPEMRAWLAATAERILELAPRRLLDVGCGTGLVLSQVAPRCESYLATDFSRHALAAAGEELKRRKLDGVELGQLAAHDLGQLDAAAFDTVVLNSVVQYFPSVEYLLGVLRDAVRLTAPGGAIFVGDVRSLPLVEDFYASVELAHAAAGAAPAGELDERIRRRRERERELLIDPAFFHALAEELPRIRRVLSRPKDAGGPDELVLFRYDAVLELDNARGPAATEAPSSHVRRRWASYANHPLRPPIAAADLRRYLAADLPEPMLPSSYVFVDALPLTPSGKVDRAALSRRTPVPGERPAPRPGEPPPSAAERTLAEIFSEVLERRDVGRDDDFFALGGHSLLATQVLSRLRRHLGVELPLRALFETPTLRGLARRLGEAATPVDPLRDPPLSPRGAPRADPRTPAPLSFPQQRLWFLHQLDPTTTAYHLPIAWRLAGRLDRRALVLSLAEVLRRHESLRTRFPSRDGRPSQVADAPPRLLVLDLAALPAGAHRGTAERAVDATFRRPFDLARGPLVRLLLARLDDERHLLLCVFHHAVFDAWSYGIFQSELAAAYGAFAAGRRPELPELEIRYADFAFWQQARLEAGALEAHLTWWREELADLETLDLPLDRPRAAGRRHRSASELVRLPADLTADLRKLCRDAGATLYMTLLAVFTALLHRLSGQRDVAVGSPVAHRNRREVEGLIGFFANNLVLRSAVPPEEGLRRLVERARETVLEADRHQDLPFEKLVEELAPERDLGRHPLYQVAFVLKNAPWELFELQGVRSTAVEIPLDQARIDLELHFWEEQGELHGSLIYDTDLFDPTTLARWSRHFGVLAAEALARPARPVADLALNGPAELHQLCVEWPAAAVLDLRGRPVPIGVAGEIAGRRVRRLAGGALEAFPFATAVAPEARPTTTGEAGRRPPERPAETPRESVAPRTATERAVAEVWSQVLAVPTPGVHDDFFTLGGHSLLAARMIERLRRRFDLSLPLTILFESSTVEALARALDERVPWHGESLLVSVRGASPSKGARAPIFCVHPGGGHVLCYKELSDHLGADQPFYGLVARGHDGRGDFHGSVEEMAADYLDAVAAVAEGPCVLAGWSMGGVVAFEMARQLRSRGGEAALVVLFDTAAPGSLERAKLEEMAILRNLVEDLGLLPEPSWADLEELDFEEGMDQIFEHARAAGVLPLPSDRERVRHLYRLFLHNTRLQREYVPRSYRGELTLFRAEELMAGSEPALGWDRWSSGVEVAVAPGDHYTMMHEPHVRGLAERLRAILARLTGREASG